MNYDQSLIPANLLNFTPSSFNQVPQPNNLLGISFPEQKQQQKKLREKRQKQLPNLQGVLHARDKNAVVANAYGTNPFENLYTVNGPPTFSSTDDNPFDSFGSDAPDDALSTPPQTPPRVKMDQTVHEYTPTGNRRQMKIKQTSLKHSQRAEHLARDDSYSTLGDDSRIQKFESILQRLEMVLVDLLQNTQRLRRV